MAETTQFTIEGSMALAYYADERHSKRVLIADEEGDSSYPEIVGGNNQSLASKIAGAVDFPNDAEFDELYHKLDELREQGLRTDEGVPDVTREVQLRITVEVL